MENEETTRKFEQSPPMGRSFPIKGRSVKLITRNAILWFQ